MLTKINNMYQNRFISKSSAKLLLFFELYKYFRTNLPKISPPLRSVDYYSAATFCRLFLFKSCIYQKKAVLLHSQRKTSNGNQQFVGVQRPVPTARMAHGKPFDGEGMLGDDQPDENSSYGLYSLCVGGGRGVMFRLDRLDGQAFAGRPVRSTFVSAAQGKSLDRTEQTALRRTEKTRVDGGGELGIES